MEEESSARPLVERSREDNRESNRRIILMLTSMFLLAAFVLGIYQSSTGKGKGKGKGSNSLPHPVVILISSDGFRFGYQWKTPTPNIHRLILEGTEAQDGLIPVFPTLTFPNHYSIVTGLYPPYHGIINNFFYDPLDGEPFSTSSHEPKWWLGEPLWETVLYNNLSAATYFWPGSEVQKGPWTCPSSFCQAYNKSVPFHLRVDTVLSYFDLPPPEIPSLITLYFEYPDHQGHLFGPDHSAISDAVSSIDSVIGRLIRGLELRSLFDHVHLIFLGDHGMVSTCDTRLIFLDDLSPWVLIPPHWVHFYTPLLSILPPPSVDPSLLVSTINHALLSGHVQNGHRLRVFLKQDLPPSLHYSHSDRIPPILGLVDEGYKVEQNRTGNNECGGAHGYHNSFFSMRSIFIGHGPRFPRGRKVPSFENVQIYNLITSILGIKGAPNNGSSSFPDSVLLPQ